MSVSDTAAPAKRNGDDRHAQWGRVYRVTRRSSVSSIGFRVYTCARIARFVPDDFARRQEHSIFLDIRRMIGDSLEIHSDRHEIKERADRFRCLGGLADDTASDLLIRMSRLQRLSPVD